MFGIGLPELILIFVLALLVLGPQRLPEVARMIGRAYGQRGEGLGGGMSDVLAQHQPEGQNICLGWYM